MDNQPASSAITVGNSYETEAFAWGLGDVLREAIAKQLDIHLLRLDEWFEEHPAAKEAMAKGVRERQQANRVQIEGALKARATGVRIYKTVIRKDGSKDTLFEDVLPDVNAGITFLERQTPEWKKDAPPPAAPVSKETLVILDGRLRERGMRGLDEIMGSAKQAIEDAGDSVTAAEAP